MKFKKASTLVEAYQAYSLVKTLDTFYPDFNHWYINKVMPGVVLGTDTLLLAQEESRIIGIALGKKDESETKLRCVRVTPKYSNSGVGVRLIDRMLDELECDKPHCTVAEEMFHLYSRVFVNRYGFALNEVKKGLYRPSKLEYFFN